jgi:hypothetical protein
MLLATLILFAAAEPPEARLAAELERSQLAFAQNESKDEQWVQLKPRIQTVLDRARRGMAGKQLWAALEDLGKIRSVLDPSLAQKGSEGRDLEAFQARWKAAAPGLIERDAKARARRWKDRPVALRAIAEAAEGQSLPLLHAAPAYAAATDPQAGFFYLEQAKATADFADLVASLAVRTRRAAPPLRSWAPELQQVQDRVIAAFQPPHSIDQHSDFIAINAQLKLAQELDSGGLPAGALYTWLDAVQQFGALEVQEPDEATRAMLVEQLAATRAELEAARRDDSIALLFVQRAEVRAGQGEWRRVRAILERVMPAYRAAMEGVPAAQRTPREEVRITLVRWPYT